MGKTKPKSSEKETEDEREGQKCESVPVENESSNLTVNSTSENVVNSSESILAAQTLISTKPSDDLKPFFQQMTSQMSEVNANIQKLQETLTKFVVQTYKPVPQSSLADRQPEVGPSIGPATDMQGAAAISLQEDQLFETFGLKLALRSMEISSTPVKQKLPISINMLYQIYSCLDQSYNSCLIWSAMTLGHFGLLRSARNSLIRVSISYLEMLDSKKLPDGTDYMVVTIKSSKTDRQNRGFSVIIGCNEHVVCAYCAMQIYIAKRSMLAGSDRPLYMYENGTSLTKALLVKHTKLYLSLVGYNPEEYSGHSYRIGGATTAAAYQHYIRAPVELLVGISNKITNRFYKTTIFHGRNAYISNCI